jgi:hypothetical protein
MSNRTLLEFNHDQAHRIKDDPAPFLAALNELLRAGGDDGVFLTLGSYGVKWHGQRHHSDGFKIEWGRHLTSSFPLSRTPI